MKKRFLYFIINLMISAEHYFKIMWFSNHGIFTAGDRVKYNWRAKVMIKSRADDKTHIIGGYEPWSKDKGNVFFADEEYPSGCSTFWIEKVK